jgi:hypothetical protein
MSEASSTFEEPKEGDYLEELVLEKRIILKWILNK